MKAEIGWRARAVAWIVALAIVTALMAQVRGALGSAHVVLAYLVVVLLASAQGGRTLGLTLSVLGFACFNFFFVPPFHTFAVAAPVDWLVLLAFLLTSVIAAQLLATAQERTAEAKRHAADVDRLATLGAEALNAGRAEDALRAVAEVIRTSLRVMRCEVHLRATDGAMTVAAFSGAEPAGRESGQPASANTGLPDTARLLAWVAENGQPAAVRADGSLRFGVHGQPETDDQETTTSLVDASFDWSGASALLLPLKVRSATVGVLALRHDDVIEVDDAARRLLVALAYYAALGAERVRLAAEVAHTEALREADQLKDALLLSVSHDLRTPLTTIKALAHAIGQDGDDRALTIVEEADRLNRFVADLLDLSRLAGGALSVTPEINAAEDLLGVALQRISGAAGDRRVDVTLDTSEPLLIGRFDFTHSLRVLVNLMENALKYSPIDSAVEVIARRAGDAREHLEFSVADRGCGVAMSERERIFEPFHRPAGSVPDAGSAGLGLSIARRLAEAQGGTVSVEARPGGGTIFVFRVPAADLDELHLPTGTAAPS